MVDLNCFSINYGKLIWKHNTEKSFITSILGSIAKKYKFLIFFVTTVIIIASVIGISKLIGYEVRNIGSIAFGVEQKIPVETTMSKLIIKEAE